MKLGHYPKITNFGGNNRAITKRYVLNITPQTFVRANTSDRIFFRIPREQLRPPGLKRLKRLEKYNEYKINLAAEAKRVRFQMPEQGAHLIFYLPVPKTWAKYKKAEKHLQLHDSVPDVDNMLKAALDSLLPEDKRIADLRITKKWINAPTGYIEAVVNLPEYPSQDTLV